MKALNAGGCHICGQAIYVGDEVKITESSSGAAHDACAKEYYIKENLRTGQATAEATFVTTGQAKTHVKFVTAHDLLLPEPGFGGCSCSDCESIRAYLVDHPDKLKRLLKANCEVSNDRL